LHRGKAAPTLLLLLLLLLLLPPAFPLSPRLLTFSPLAAAVAAQSVR
jgi:hypothetical protein